MCPSLYCQFQNHNAVVLLTHSECIVLKAGLAGYRIELREWGLSSLCQGGWCSFLQGKGKNPVSHAQHMGGDELIVSWPEEVDLSLVSSRRETDLSGRNGDILG